MDNKNRYFRLFPEIVHIVGPVAGALYLLLQSRVFALDPIRNEVLKELEANLSLGETAQQTGLSVSEIEKFLAMLEELGAGCFMDRPCFVEKIRPFNPVEEFTFFRPAPQVNNLHIVLTNQCSQNCTFCQPGKLTARLHPCLGCWRGIGEYEQTLTVDHIKKALKETACLSCHSLILHAGDANLVKDIIIEIVPIAIKNSYTSIQLVTGTALSKPFIDQLIEFKTVPIFQIYSNRESHHDKISGRKGNFTLLVENFSYLRKKKFPFKLVYLFTGADLDPHSVLVDLQNFGPIEIYSDRLIKTAFPVADFIYGMNYLVAPDINSYISKQKNHTCLSNRLALNSDGKYYPCPLLLEHELGHVFKNTVQEIFAKEKIQKYWEGYITEDASCNKCEFRFACHLCKVISPHYDKKFICGYNPHTGCWYNIAD